MVCFTSCGTTEKPPETSEVVTENWIPLFNGKGLDRDAEKWVARDGEILTSGYIVLQAESHPIDFKNVALLELK